MKRYRIPFSALFLLGAGGAVATPYYEANNYPYAQYDTKFTLGYQAEGHKDLGFSNNGEEATLFALVQPRIKLQINENWYAYSYAEFFIADNVIELNDDFDDSRSDGYGAIREAWIDYNGFGRFPRESLRFGLERLREDSALWWDKELTLARYRFITTMLEAYVGIGEQLDYLRTDDIELNPSRLNRLRLFGSIDYQWTYNHWMGLKLATATDQSDRGNELISVQDEQTPFNRDYLWFGAQANNGYYNWEVDETFQYTVNLMALTGTNERIAIEGDEAVTSSRDVNAWAADLGLRTKLNNFNIGAHLFYASGGIDADSDNQFQQTGLNTNRSRYTGTRTQVSRLGEAVRGELTNIEAYTAYISYQASEKLDWSLALHSMSRVDKDQPVELRGVSADPNTDDTDIGKAYDFVIAYYFDKRKRNRFGEIDWLSDSFIRLRSGLFDPGKAFGEPEEDSSYFLALEFKKNI